MLFSPFFIKFFLIVSNQHEHSTECPYCYLQTCQSNRVENSSIFLMDFPRQLLSQYNIWGLDSLKRASFPWRNWSDIYHISEILSSPPFFQTCAQFQRSDSSRVHVMPPHMQLVFRIGNGFHLRRAGVGFVVALLNLFFLVAVSHLNSSKGSSHLELHKKKCRLAPPPPQKGQQSE